MAQHPRLHDVTRRLATPPARAHLRGQLGEEVVVGGEGPDVDTVPDGGGQRLDLVEAAVQLVQGAEPAEQRDRD